MLSWQPGSLAATDSTGIAYQRRHTVCPYLAEQSRQTVEKEGVGERFEGPDPIVLAAALGIPAFDDTGRLVGLGHLGG